MSDRCTCKPNRENPSVIGACACPEHGMKALMRERDALAAYVAWRWNPAGDAPITLDDLRTLMARLGHALPGDGISA